MAVHFDPSCVSVIYQSIQERINYYNCPGRVFVPCKPRPFGNNYHTIVFAKSKVVYNVDIVEGEDRPILMGKKEFEERGETAVLW